MKNSLRSKRLFLGIIAGSMMINTQAMANPNLQPPPVMCRDAALLAETLGLGVKAEQPNALTVRLKFDPVMVIEKAPRAAQKDPDALIKFSHHFGERVGLSNDDVDQTLKAFIEAGAIGGPLHTYALLYSKGEYEDSLLSEHKRKLNKISGTWTEILYSHYSKAQHEDGGRPLVDKSIAMVTSVVTALKAATHKDQLDDLAKYLGYPIDADGIQAIKDLSEILKDERKSTLLASWYRATLISALASQQLALGNQRALSLLSVPVIAGAGFAANMAASSWIESLNINTPETGLIAAPILAALVVSGFKIHKGLVSLLYPGDKMAKKRGRSDAAPSIAAS